MAFRKSVNVIVYGLFMAEKHACDYKKAVAKHLEWCQYNPIKAGHLAYSELLQVWVLLGELKWTACREPCR